MSDSTPATPTISGPTTFCSGGAVTLTSSSASGNQWYLNGNALTLATNQSMSTSVPGDYTVIVTIGGCSSAPSAATTVTQLAKPDATITALGEYLTIDVYPPFSTEPGENARDGRVHASMKAHASATNAASASASKK